MPAAVARLKQGDGPDLLTQGSSVLVQSLLAAGLVDELSLLIFPVLLGRGKRLFGERGARPASSSWSRARISTTGVIIARYRPSGADSHRLVPACRAERRPKSRAARRMKEEG